VHCGEGRGRLGRVDEVQGGSRHALLMFARLLMLRPAFWRLLASGAAISARHSCDGGLIHCVWFFCVSQQAGSQQRGVMHDIGCMVGFILDVQGPRDGWAFRSGSGCNLQAMQ
jgi:hypothetical protein